MILQYGSALFGSETKESDYDIIVASSIKTWHPKATEPALIREQFFFRDFMKALSETSTLSTLKVYEVRHAKVPILKMKYNDCLSLDVSLGIVLNE